MAIRLGILGYGNLGRALECAIMQNDDTELACVFTRRDPKDITILTPSASVKHISEARNMQDEIDVMVLCGGSAKDLPEQTPQFARMFNVVDSYDTHGSIPRHFAETDKAAKSGGKTAVISAGWDPGIFSLMRAYFLSSLSVGSTYTFWGKGVSQGHSDAIRTIDGVSDARQYTVPVEEAIASVRKGERPELTPRQIMRRECFVVVKDGADKEKIENEIKNMPDYFADYDTTVRFISKEELERDHSAMPHGGFVIRSGQTGQHEENNSVMELSLKLDSNPEFTSSVLLAFARAAYRLSKEGETGCKTVFDIAPKYLLNLSDKELAALL